MASYPVVGAPRNIEQQQRIEAVWAAALVQLQHGSSDIVINEAMCNSIGQQGVVAIADRFSAFIGTRASILHEPSLGVVRILQPQQIVASRLESKSQTPCSPISEASPTTPTTAPPSPDLDAQPNQSRASMNHKAKVAKDRLMKIPRPPNAFILYRQQKHPIIKSQEPDIHNNQISVKIGEMWSNEPEEVKQMFRNRAEAVKRQHIADHPEYQYQPRKPSEKKRRVTKGKAARRNASRSNAPSPGNGNVPGTASPPLPSSNNQHGFPGQVEFGSSLPHAANSQTLQSWVMPKVIPEFERIQNGQIMTHEFDPMQPGLFMKMIEKHNESISPNIPGVVATIRPQLLWSGVGESTKKQHDHQLSPIDFQSRDAEIAHLRETIATALEPTDPGTNRSIPQHYNSEQAYNEHWATIGTNYSNRFTGLEQAFGDLSPMSIDPMLDAALPIPPQYETALSAEQGSGSDFHTFVEEDYLGTSILDGDNEFQLFGEDFFNI